MPLIKYSSAQQGIQTQEKRKETWNDHYSKYKLPSLITGTSSEQVMGTGIGYSGELATKSLVAQTQATTKAEASRGNCYLPYLINPQMVGTSKVIVQMPG